MVNEGGNEIKSLLEREDVFHAAGLVGQNLDCDIVLLNSDVERGVDNEFINKVGKYKRAKNLLMLIVTPGGDADVAYRIARCAQDNYEQFIVFVSGYCKSAGTLCVLGANEIVMSDLGELGPLDVQLYKKDELGEMHSGLVIGEALELLQDQAFSMFENYFLKIKQRSKGTVTFKTATETAAKMVTGLFQPVYSQIDPTIMGDIGRSMTIAKDYGERLLIKSGNFSSATLDLLVESYPSHGFVIDRREAESLFSKVRAPSEEEEVLAQVLRHSSRYPNGRIVEFLYPNPKLEQALKEKEHASESETEPAGAVKDASRGVGAGSDDGNPQQSEGAPQLDPENSDIALPTGTEG